MTPTDPVSYEGGQWWLARIRRAHAQEVAYRGAEAVTPGHVAARLVELLEDENADG